MNDSEFDKHKFLAAKLSTRKHNEPAFHANIKREKQEQYAINHKMPQSFLQYVLFMLCLIWPTEILVLWCALRAFGADIILL